MSQKEEGNVRSSSPLKVHVGRTVEISSVLGPDPYLIQYLPCMVLLVSWLDSQFILWPLGCWGPLMKTDVKKM